MIFPAVLTMEFLDCYRATITRMKYPPECEASLNVIYEDEDFVVVNKPAGLVCHPTKGDEYSSLIGRLRIFLTSTSQPHLVNRLDRETSGLVVVAKNKMAAAGLGAVWEKRQAKKMYDAIVHGSVEADGGLIDAPLGRDEGSAVAVKDCIREDGAMARTQFWTTKRFHRSGGSFSVLKVMPHTGRKHQIRIHLQHIGHSVVGDKLYGLDPSFYLAFVRNELAESDRAQLLLPYQALHAARLEFNWNDRLYVFDASPEKWFCDFIAPSSQEAFG